MPDAKPSRAQTEREQDIIALREKIGETRRQEGIHRAAADRFAEECKGSGLNPATGLTDEDKDAFDRIDKAYREADEYAEQAIVLEHRLERLVTTTGHEAQNRARGDLQNPDVRRAAGMAAAFMASQEYKRLKASGDLEMEGSRCSTASVGVATRAEFMAMLRGVSTAAVGSDALIPEDQQLFPPVGIPVRQLRVRDLVDVQTTDTDTIEWVEETARTDAAAETSYGVLAPESTYTYARKQAFVKRIPHYVKATRAQLNDAGQLRGLLDNRLVYGVGKRLDGQMINGLGAGDDLRGILETASLQAVDGSAISVPDVFHRGLTAVRLSLEDEPDAYLVHPSTYEQFVLAKGTDQHYLNLQGPQFGTPPTIWGKPVVTSTVIPSTSALVGAWRQGATLWVREGVRVAVTDSDGDDFRKGIITILAEMRVAFAVQQVKAFAEITDIGLTA